MFKVYKSNHMERLVDVLGELLEEAPESVFEPELISVQSLGMRRWLSMRLAEKLKICANVEFPFPRDLMGNLFEKGLGPEYASSKFVGLDHLIWRLMSILPELVEQEEFALLKNFIEPQISHPLHQNFPDRLPGQGDANLGSIDAEMARGAGNQTRLFQLASKIADTFDQYSVYRPEIIRSWDQGTQPGWIPASFSWQRILWQEISKGTDDLKHLPAVAREFTKSAETGALKTKDLPRRICLFGITTLPPLYLDILSAAARHMDINLFYLSPSREYWAHIRSKRDILREARKAAVSMDELEKTLHMEEGNSLLASMGRMGRDFQSILESQVDYVEPADDLFEQAPSMRKTTLLSTIQSDILHLRQGSAPMLDEADQSLAIHSCHSELREVEVVRDQLRDIFEKNPKINPHDVIVMTPDIEKYAPMIDAVFGSLEGIAKIPYTISDRSIKGEAPVMESFMSLLDMAKARTSIVEVFDLLSQEPIMERFGMSANEVEQAHQWAKEAGVRWGLDGKHREIFGQPDMEQNTWRFGLERLFLGYALPSRDELLFEDRLAYDEIEGSSAEFLGKFAEFFKKLSSFHRAMRQDRTPAAWEKLLVEILQSMTSDNSSHGFYHQYIRSTLRDLSSQAQDAGFESSLGVEVIRDYLRTKFTQPSSQRFMSGGVTFCKLLPMRSIPHKLVCLMGMNDTDYPREQSRLGFDLVAKYPRLADRSMRHDDRYQFLEAILSAREKLIITYQGQSIRDNRTKAMSVLVDELLDYVEQLIRRPDDDFAKPSIRQHLLVQHPMQAFSQKYFDSADSKLFGYDQDLRDAASRVMSHTTEQAFFPSALPEQNQQELWLDELVSFFNLPVKFLLENALGIYLPDKQETESEREPLVLNALDQYKLGQWLLDAALANKDPDDAKHIKILKAKGSLPLGELGKLEFRKLSAQVRPLAKLARQHTGDVALPAVDLNISFGDTRLLGNLDSLWPQGMVTAGFGKTKPKRVLSAWIRHLALGCIEQLPCPTQSFLIGRDTNNEPHVISFRKVREPNNLLRDLIELFILGQTRPLAFFPETSMAQAALSLEAPGLVKKKIMKYMDPNKMWSGGFKNVGESENKYSNLVFGRLGSLKEMDQETNPSFSDLAQRIFGPLLEHLEGSEP